MNASLTADCYPISVVPGQNRLLVDYCSGARAALEFYGSPAPGFRLPERPAAPEHWAQIAEILSAQNTSASAAPALRALRDGAGMVVTGQQVALFGGPLFTPFKAATALARARQASATGQPHVAVFWLASEDHDFAEVNHVTFPARRELKKFAYTAEPDTARPVGGIVLGDEISALVEQAGEVLGASDALDALAAAWQPGRTFAQAFAEFYSKAFAAQGLLLFDASGRDVHRLGAPVLRAAIERADEIHAALMERNRELEAAGYGAQVAVTDGSSLLFLIDKETGARVG